MGNEQHQWASNPNRKARRVGQHHLDQHGGEGQPSRQFANVPDTQRLTLGILLVNRLLNTPSHRPDAVRLLRQILHERAIRHAVSLRDENHQFG